MSYTVQQLQITNGTFKNNNRYTTKLERESQEFSISSVITTYNMGTNQTKNFSDIQILANFEKDKTYYFKGIIHPETRTSLISKFTVTVSLYNEATNNTNASMQFLESFSISGDKSIELIFTPQISYTGMLFKISRSYVDFLFQEGLSIQLTGEDEITIDEQKIKSPEIYRIQNIIRNTVIKKIGIQGTPGLKMIINQEGFWMNPTGIFEINDEYDINFLGFVITDNNKEESLKQPIIVDYLT